MENKKSYYAVIPACVRYDETLPANAKLLYGEITALSNEKGYCWANNRYFAKQYGCTRQAVSLWIQKLIKRGYVRVEYTQKEGATSERKIYINVEKI